MSKKAGPSTKRAKRSIPSPDTLLEAANKAPQVFNVSAYFKPLYVMRKKGHPWRYLAGVWLKSFNIEISHVHLHRLYSKEDARLSRLSRKELLEMGMPRKMIDEREAKDDPTKRLVAADPEDEPDEGEDEGRR
jgi:hypothetical protein